jgi:hypothetical protein
MKIGLTKVCFVLLGKVIHCIIREHLELYASSVILYDV